MWCVSNIGANIHNITNKNTKPKNIIYFFQIGLKMYYICCCYILYKSLLMTNNKKNYQSTSSSNNKGCLIVIAILVGISLLGKLLPDKDKKTTQSDSKKEQNYIIVDKGTNGFKSLFEIEVPEIMSEPDLDKIGRELEAQENLPIFIRFSTADSRIYGWGNWATYDESSYEGAEIKGFKLEQMQTVTPLINRLKPNYKAVWLLNIMVVPKIYVLEGDSITIIHKDFTYGSHKIEHISESMFKRSYETYYIEKNGDMSIISAEGKKQYTCKKVKF